VSGFGRIDCLFSAATARVAVALTIGQALGADEKPVPVTALAFSPDGAALVSHGPRRVELRSPSDGTVKSHFACDLPKITSLAFHPAGNLLAIAGGEPAMRGEVQLLEWPVQKIRQRIAFAGDLVSAAVFNRDGRLLGIAGADHKARVWKTESDTSSFREAFTLTGHAGPVLAIAFSPSGETVTTASADRSIKVWSTGDGKLLRTLSHHLDAVNALAFRPLRGGDHESQPSACASASDDRTVRIWQPETGRMVRIIRGPRAPVLALTYAAGGASLFAAGKEGIIRRFDADSDTLLGEWPAHGDWIYALAASPNGTKLAAGDWTGQVRIIDVSHP
jgi:WD40 repeat protein